MNRKLLLTLIAFCAISIFYKGNLYCQPGSIKFIDYFFEHASPLCWELQGDTIHKIYLFPDYERESVNRQTTHWYFGVEAEKGTKVRFLLSKLLPGAYNGKVSNVRSMEKNLPCYISFDRKTWDTAGTLLSAGGDLIVEFTMKEDYAYVARMPQYTLTDLEDLKKQIKGNNLIKIFNIGMTVEKRPLEIIQLGNPDAPYHFLIRARAHPWESGGNWLVEGLIKEFLDRSSKEWQDKFCVYIMPMSNKDGVMHGMSRFNLKGKDLNRNWEEKSDPELCPEKYALEEFIESLIRQGKKPCLCIDLHNDSSGGLHLSRFSNEDAKLMANMKLFEALMRKHTSYSETVKYSSSDVTTFSCGLYERYGIEAIIYELNANWMSSLKKVPSKNAWMDIGKNMNTVFYEYSNQKR